MDNLLDMTLDEQMHHNRRNNSRNRRRRDRDWDSNEGYGNYNYDGSQRFHQRRRYNQHNQAQRSSSHNYRNRNRHHNNNDNYSNRHQNYDNYNNNNRSHSYSSSRRQQYNTYNTNNANNNQYDHSETFEINMSTANDTQYDYESNYNPIIPIDDTNNTNTQTNDNISNLYNEYKVNEWIENQNEIQKSILKNTIGLEFDMQFYRSGLMKNNHGWPRGHSFEAEHKKFCVPLDENECKYAKMDTLPTDYPLKEYQRRTNETKFHYKKWGQRKLLMTEIQFLSNYFDLGEKITVVYAGAAPGHHTPFLADLFPNISFELWDPASFHEENFHHKRILVNNGCPHHHFRSRNNKKEECCYFTDEISQKYGERVKNGENILFISDIRTADWRNQNQLDVEDFVLRDNELQFKWVKYINPLKAHLKFRCPYPDRVANLDKYEYFDGILYFQAWLAPTSTEMRLVVDKKLQLKEYNIHKYEQQLFWWNNVARQTNINNPYYFAQIGFINTYDCYLEAIILETYFKKMFAFNNNNNNNNYDALKYLIPLTVHRITRMLSPNGNKTLLTRFKGISAHRQIDHTKHYQAMDNDKKRKQKTKTIEKTHLNTLRFNNNRNQKQLKTRECIEPINENNIKFKSILKYLKDTLKINDIKNLLIDKCNNIDSKIDIIKNGILNSNINGKNVNKYKIFYHNNTTHFSLIISINKYEENKEKENEMDQDDDDDDNVMNLRGCFVVDYSNDKIEIFELTGNHVYKQCITDSFHLNSSNDANDNDNNMSLITVVLGKFIYNFDVPIIGKQNKNKINDEDKEDSKEDDYEFLIHDVLIFNSKTNKDFESRLKVGNKIIKIFNDNICKLGRNIRFILLQLYDLNDIISMYCNFKYFGALNGPTAWNSSFKTDDFTMNEAVRGGILAKDNKIDKNLSKYCKIIKCNGISIINISNSSNLLWLNKENSYLLIGLNTNLNTNPMLMATNMDDCRKSLLYDLNKQNVIGFTTVPNNVLTFDSKEYILVDSCIKQIYLNEIDYNTNIEIYEKEIQIDGIQYGLGIEYFVSYLPQRMDYNVNYYTNVKNNIVYEIDIIKWYLNTSNKSKIQNIQKTPLFSG